MQDMRGNLTNTDWEHFDPDDYRRIYKGLDLSIKVKYDYSKFYIRHGHKHLDVWFDGRIRSGYEDEVESVQKRMEARADEWAELIAGGYLDTDDD